MDGLGTDDERSPLTAPKSYTDDPGEGEAATTGDNQPPGGDREPTGQPTFGPPLKSVTTQHDGTGLGHPQQQGSLEGASAPGTQDDTQQLLPGATQKTPGFTTFGEHSPLGLQMMNEPGVVPQQPPTVDDSKELGPGVHGALDGPPVFQSTPQVAHWQMPGGYTPPPPGAQPVLPWQVPQGVFPDPSSQGSSGQASPVMNQPQHAQPTANSQLQQQQQPYQHMQQHPANGQPAPGPAAYHQQQHQGPEPMHRDQHYHQQQQQQQQQHQDRQQELHFPVETPQRSVKVSLTNQYQPLVNTCPQCHSGVMAKRFNIVGILLAIFCFPCGLICCLLMRENRCSHCGLTI